LFGNFLKMVVRILGAVNKLAVDSTSTGEKPAGLKWLASAAISLLPMPPVPGILF
jgi:hypothetical protein